MDQSTNEPKQEAGMSPETTQLDEFQKKIAELTKANTILKANISTLYRTARAEIERKNKMITELQSELDDLIFKRMDRKMDQGKLNPTTTNSSA